MIAVWMLQYIERGMENPRCAGGVPGEGASKAVCLCVATKAREEEGGLHWVGYLYVAQTKCSLESASQ